MTRPNIVMFLVDDLGWMDLTCQGSRFYETPNIDRIAREGMRFTQAYAAAPVCSPTRASILSGKYPARLGTTQWFNSENPSYRNRGILIDAPYVDHLALEEKSVAAVLRENGYATWHVGKWHLGKEPYFPERHGFDVNIAGCHMGHPWHGYFSPWNIPTLANGPDGEYLTDCLARKAGDLIRGHRGGPFYLNMWFYQVHEPIQGKPDKVRKYRAKAAEMGLDQQIAFQDAGEYHLVGKRGRRYAHRIVQSDPEYAAMVESLDEAVGAILHALEETGRLDNTLVLFSSDNGGLAMGERPPTTNLPLARGKSWTHEGGLRVPLLARWPGVVPPGSTCDTPAISTDFYPTLLEVAGLPLMPDQHRDGLSLMPLLKSTGRPSRDCLYWHCPHYNETAAPSAAVRRGDHKLIRFFEDEHGELYNVRTDPGETEDLAMRMPELASDLRRQLQDWQNEMKALYPERNPEWRREGGAVNVDTRVKVEGDLDPGPKTH